MSENNNLIPSGEINREMDSIESIAKIIKAINNLPITLRRKFRGESLHRDVDGNSTWVQASKPTFVVIDYATDKPKMEMVKMPWGEEEEKYIANDEAIDEVLSMIEFMGVNEINPVGFNTPDNYQDDLKEFECKLAALLAMKQKEWGIDKELLPMLHQKIKTLVQDVRSLSINGKFLKQIATNTQRVDQYVQHENQGRSKSFGPY